MRCRLKVKIQLLSDYHLGTGTGRGRTVDAVIVKGPSGLPYLLGSSIKGLARHHAESTLVPTLFSTSHDVGLIDGVFGAQGSEPGTFYFDDFHLAPSTVSDRPIVVGRNARDRQSGITANKALFFQEVGAAATFESIVEGASLPDDASGVRAMLLVVMALRKIESLGASRRRGRGRCKVTVEIIDGPAGLKGKQLPQAGADDWLSECLNNPQRMVEPAEPPEEFSPDSSRDETMACLPILGLAATPLVLAADQGTDNVILSLDYIPGSALRGAFAHGLLKNGQTENSDLFQQLIVRERLHFGPLYPMQDNSARLSRMTMPVPVPASFVEGKDESGELRSDGYKGRQSHGIRDRLYFPDDNECGCRASLVPRAGWGALSQSDRMAPLELRLWNSPQFTIQRTEISKETQRATPNMLYATEAIPAETWFAGYVWGPQWALDFLSSRIRTSLQSVRIGKSRTRGHGKLLLWDERASDQPTGYSSKRDPYYPLLYAAESQYDRCPESRFSLTCYSELIVVDAWLRPLTTITARDLWRFITLPGDGTTEPPFQISRAYVRQNRVAGFNGRPGLPRVVDVAISAGSCWQLEWDPKVSNETRSFAWDRLLLAHRQGLGLRRAEGFGRIMVNSPLHEAHFNQNSFAGNPDIDLADHASTDVAAHADAFPNNSASSPLASGGLAPMVAAWQWRDARDLAAKCDHRIRGAAARILWQCATSANPQAQLEQWLSELEQVPYYDTPHGKTDASRKLQLKFLKSVSESLIEPPARPQNLAATLRITAESLQ